MHLSLVAVFVVVSTLVASGDGAWLTKTVKPTPKPVPGSTKQPLSTATTRTTTPRLTTTTTEEPMESTIVESSSTEWTETSDESSEEMSTSSVTEERMSTASVSRHPPLPITDSEDCKELLQVERETAKHVRLMLEHVELIRNNTVRNIHTPCTINVTSVSASTPTSSETKEGLILVNGNLCGKCNNKLSGEGSNPGLLLCVVDPTDCTIKDTRLFDTHSEDSLDDGQVLKNYLDILGDHQTVVGTSCGESVVGLGDAKHLLKAYNVTLDDAGKGEMYTFILQTREPTKTKFVHAKPEETELKESYHIVGENTLDYGYSKDSKYVPRPPRS